MFTVYALKSLSHNFIYVGMTENLEKRLQSHNSGYNKSTKRFTPFKVIYSENCETGEEARVREKYFKSTSGKRFLRSVLNENKNAGIGRLSACVGPAELKIQFTELEVGLPNSRLVWLDRPPVLKGIRF